ncbi:MAG: InlB B-repeat-containing protein, partial [Bacilli bacterium]|nr:InlB B-repeat-containing protein [Bacilli bacterium]
NSHAVTLNYNNGGGVHTQTVVHNGYVIQPQISYTGHHLLKWTYESGGDFNFSTPITSDGIKIVANWELDTCNITYVTNGGTITGAPITSVEYGKTILNAPTLADRPGYVKENVTWWTTDTFTPGTQFTFGAIGTGTTVTTNITLYAKWPAINKCTVTFNGNGGKWGSNTTKVITVDYGSNVYTPVAPILEYNSLVGWFTLASGGIAFDFSNPITTNVEVFAHWDVTTYHTVTFNTQGGSSIKSATIAHGSTVSRPTLPTYKDGYTFIEWYDSAAGGSVWNFDTRTITEDVTIYAHWSDITVFQVDFYDDDGETLLCSVDTNYGDKVTRPEDPSKDGYSFKYWCLIIGGEKEFNFDAPIYEDKIVYAYYEPEQYHIRWLNADINHTPLVTAENYDAGELPSYKGTTPTLAPDLNHRYKFKGFSPEILPVDDNMTYFATYDYDDEINFHYISDSYPLNGEFDYRSVEFYGGLIAMEFDSANTAETVLSNASFTIDGTSYTKAQLSSDLYQGETEIEEEVVKTNYLYLKVSYVSTNAFVRNARSIEMEAMFL